MSKLIEWIKANSLIAMLIGVVVVILLFGRKLKRLFMPVHRVRHRKAKELPARRRRVARTNRRPLPRSVGMHRATGKGYPKAGGGYIPFKRNKDGSIKKAWQVAGTVAAKSRMKRLRSAR